jgi:outer membrane lipoprotein carrier protein
MSPGRSSWLAAFVAVIVLASGEPRGADATPAEFGGALQRRYERIKDFSADFMQSYRGGVLKRTLVERGRVLVKKPGKMRWEYTAPETKLFVSDGVKAYFYVPKDRQVMVSSAPSVAGASTPALFLAGRGHIVRDFTPSWGDVPSGFPAGSRGLKLVPKTPQPDYDWLMVVADPVTLAIRGLVTVDAQGGTSTFTFANLKENVGMADNAFDFKMPRGVDVVTDSSSR